jgi:WD40 repeat protein
VAFHPYGNYLLTASNDSTLKIFNLLKGEIFCTLERHQSAAFAAAFSKDGKYFASGDNDKQVMVWQTNFGQQHEGNLANNVTAKVCFVDKNHQTQSSASNATTTTTSSSSLHAYATTTTPTGLSLALSISSLSLSSADSTTQRDQTIPPNESQVQDDEDGYDLDLTSGAIFKATSTSTSTAVTNKPGLFHLNGGSLGAGNQFGQLSSIKKLAHTNFNSNGEPKSKNNGHGNLSYGEDSGSSSSRSSTNTTSTGSETASDIGTSDISTNKYNSANIYHTLKYIIQQMEIITQVKSSSFNYRVKFRLNLVI